MIGRRTIVWNYATGEEFELDIKLPSRVNRMASRAQYGDLYWTSNDGVIYWAGDQYPVKDFIGDYPSDEIPQDMPLMEYSKGPRVDDPCIALYNHVPGPPRLKS